MNKQLGYNKKYPETVDTWKFGSTSVPEWLSDRAKVKFIDGEGNLTLDILETNTGGYEIKNTEGTGALLLVPGKDDFVCYGDGKIFSLTPVQFKLLYK